MKTTQTFHFERAGRPPLEVVLEIDASKAAHQLASRAVQHGKKGKSVLGGAVKVRLVNP